MGIRRINLMGGPGTGKSTLAAKIFSTLKSRQHDVVLISEYIKPRAYRGQFPTSHEQVYVFAKQQHAEDELLPHCKAIVTDSPLLMNAAYSKKYGFRGYNEIIALAKLFEDDYPGLYFGLARKYDYVQSGRYQAQDECRVIDKEIEDLMKEHLPRERYFVEGEDFAHHDLDAMLTIIEDRL